NYSVSGSAINGVDYQLLSGTVHFNPYQLSATVALNPLDDNVVEGPQVVILTIQSGTGYNINTPSSASYEILEEDGPGPVLPVDPCGCSSSLTDLIQTNPGLAKSGPLFSDANVRYSDGVIENSRTDLESDGFGTTWGQSESWTNAADASASTTYGN